MNRPSTTTMPATELFPRQTRWRARRLRTPLVLGMSLLAAATSVAVPAVAQAAEGVSSSYDVGCSLRPEDGGYAESGEPGGVSFDGVQSDATASPALRTLTATTTASYPAGAADSGEDCAVNVDVADRLTVGAGSTGLTAGDTVPVEITVRLNADVTEAWDLDGSFRTYAAYGAGITVRSLDGCTSGGIFGGEAPVCDTPLQFSANHEHQLIGAPPDSLDADGYVQATQSFRSHELTTNIVVPGTPDQDEQRYTDEGYLDESRPGHVDGTELCDTWAGCTPRSLHEAVGLQVITAPATLVVGNRYQITGFADLITAAYDNADVQATASIGELSVSITPAAEYEGVELGYASAGGPATDTAAPDVVAGVAPSAVNGWHTAPPRITFSATDAGSGVASITYGTSGAVTTAETVVPSDSAALTVATDGITEVTYRATDVAGNVSEPQTLIVRLDSVAPTLAALPDVTVEATNPDGAIVTFSVTAPDATATGCDPASGATFPLGTTTVSCTATDAAGNTARDSFDVRVVDTTAPVLSLPRDYTVDVFDPKGLSTNFLVTATDAADPAPVVACTPPPGTILPTGQTTVACTATDASGNVSTGSFVVTVLDPRQVITLLREDLLASSIARATKNHLLERLDFADRALDKNDWRGVRHAAESVVRHIDQHIPPGVSTRRWIAAAVNLAVGVARAHVLLLSDSVRNLARTVAGPTAIALVERIQQLLEARVTAESLAAMEKAARELDKVLSSKGGAGSLSPEQVATARAQVADLLDKLKDAKGAFA